MLEVLIVTSGVFVGLFVTSLIFYFVEFSTHRRMVLRDSDIWDYATFNQFLIEYNKITWNIDPGFPESRFEVNGLENVMDRRNYFHADIIKFGDKGLVIRFIDIWKFIRFKKRLKKEAYEKFDIKKTRVQGLWSKKEKENPTLDLVK